MDYVHVPEIKLIRTDTTLDLSQKAENGDGKLFFVCLYQLPKRRSFMGNASYGKALEQLPVTEMAVLSHNFALQVVLQDKLGGSGYPS